MCVTTNARIIRLLIDFLESKLLVINNDVLLIHHARQYNANASYQSSDGTDN